MKKLALLAALVAAPATAEGPISKFEAKTPTAAYVSVRKLEDIERCLIDMEGFIAPTVYRQPDRPDDVTIHWKAGAMGLSVGRVDLHREPGGTRITSWFSAKQVTGCAPTS